MAFIHTFGEPSVCRQETRPDSVIMGSVFIRVYCD